MQIRYILMVIVIIFAIFIYTGNRNAELSVSIDECSAKFYNDTITVTSDLCAVNKTCQATPYQQQNNAVVDVLLCACGKAQAANYADEGLNGKINSLAYSFFRYNITANEICESQTVLSKTFYG